MATCKSNKILLQNLNKFSNKTTLKLYPLMKSKSKHSLNNMINPSSIKKTPTALPFQKNNIKISTFISPKNNLASVMMTSLSATTLILDFQETCASPKIVNSIFRLNTLMNWKNMSNFGAKAYLPSFIRMLSE